MDRCEAEKVTEGRRVSVAREGIEAAKVDQGREAHYCTRPAGHTGGHLCPCGYYWTEAN